MDFEKDIPCYFHVKYREEMKLFKIPWENLSFESFKNMCKYF